MNNLRDTLSRKSLLPEPSLDIVEDLSMRRVGLVQQVLKRKVRRPKTVTEVLREDPATIWYAFRALQKAKTHDQSQSHDKEMTSLVGLTSISSFLHGVRSARCTGGVEEGVVGEAVEKGGFLHHLEDGVLDRGSICAGQGVQVQTDDRDAV